MSEKTLYYESRLWENEIIAVFELHSQHIASTSYMKESGVLRTNKLTIPI